MDRKGPTMSLRSLALLGGAVAAGYVLGTRTGRARLERFASRANDVLHDPRTQQTVADTADQVRRQAGRLPDPVADVVRTAADQVHHHFDHRSPATD